MPKTNWGSFRSRREEKWGSFRGRFGDHFGVGIISGSIWGSFRGRYHFGVNLGIISGLEIISGRDHVGGCTGHAHLY